jgi:hypothetical protein
MARSGFTDFRSGQLQSHASRPWPSLLQHKDKYGGLGRGRLLRIAADRLQSAAVARRREREAAVARLARGFGRQADQVRIAADDDS